MLAVIYGSLWGPRRRLSSVSRYFVSQSPRFRGVVNQANTSRTQRGLYELARRTRRVVGASRELYDRHAFVKNRHTRIGRAVSRSWYSEMFPSAPITIKMLDIRPRVAQAKFATPEEEHRVYLWLSLPWTIHADRNTSSGK